jgi:hypothetical protein
MAFPRFADHSPGLEADEKRRPVDDRSLAGMRFRDREPAFERNSHVDDSARERALPPVRMGNSQLPDALSGPTISYAPMRVAISSLLTPTAGISNVIFRMRPG